MSDEGLRAWIGDDLLRGGIRVVFAFQSGHSRSVWAPGGPRMFVSTDDATEPDVEPCRMTDEEGRALLTALNRYYEGGEDTRSLRRDYDAERKRVDTFIAHLTADPTAS